MPNGPNPDELEYLQHEFTDAYRARIEKYRAACCLWCVATSDGYIVITNPYWLSALGWTKDELNHKSIFGLLKPEESAQILDKVSHMLFEDIEEELIYLRHKDGSHSLFLCWFQKWQVKSTGIRITYMTGVSVDTDEH